MAWFSTRRSPIVLPLVLLALHTPVFADESEAPHGLEQAEALLNLETFPRLDGAVDETPRRLASLAYTAVSSVEAAYQFQKAAMEERGWSELPGSYFSEELASGTFARDSSRASVSVLPNGEPDTVRVAINQHGNVVLSRLPTPPGAKRLFVGPAAVMYVTATPIEETRQSVDGQLRGQGWEPYGEAGDVTLYKQNAVRLSARVAPAPAQNNQTSLAYSAELLSTDLPAPADARNIEYADITKQLSFETPGTPEELFENYREILGPSGWKSTSDAPARDGKSTTFLFLNPERDVIEIQAQSVDGVHRVRVRHRSAAEVAELARAAAEEPAPSDSGKITIPVPFAARELQVEPRRIEFELPAGQARAYVESIRDRLEKHGWKIDLVEIGAMAGTVAATKEKVSLSVSFVDTGLTQAEITFLSIGMDLQPEKDTSP